MVGREDSPDNYKSLKISIGVTIQKSRNAKICS